MINNLRPNKITFTAEIKWQKLREERCKHEENTRCVKPLRRPPSGKIGRAHV